MSHKSTGKQVISKVVAVSCAVFWLLSLVLFVHRQEIFIIGWDKIPIGSFRHDVGHAWYVKFVNRSFTPPSRAVLMEDGTALKRANAAVDAVAFIGGGRYNISNDELLFSTSDNSDPTTNGRKYELLCATSVDWGVQRVIFFLAVLSTAVSVIIIASWQLKPLRAIESPKSCKSVDF